MAYVCVPEGKRGDRRVLKKQADGEWTATGWKVLGATVASTVTLGIGWLIHICW
jgi:hypothetical protein